MKVKHLFLPFLLFFLVSCNNQPTTPKNELILGVWKLTEWYSDTPIDINNDGKSSKDLLSQWNGCFKTSKIEFSDKFDYVKIIYTGSNENPKCPPNFKTNDYSTTPPWKIEDDELIFIGDDYFDVYQIVELTNKTLILKGAGFLTCCDEEISYYTDGYLKFKKK